MEQNNQPLAEDPVSQLYDVASTLRLLHEDCGEKYPELVFILKSMERAVDESAAHFDGMEELLAEYQQKN